MSGISDHLHEPDDYAGDAIEPGVSELLQEIYPGPAVPVRVTGPLTVNELPTRDAVSRNITVSDQTNPPESITNEDLRRKFLYITVTGQPCYVGFDKASVAAGTCGILPVGQLLPLPTGMPIYVKAAAVGQAVVSYWAGSWAD